MTFLSGLVAFCIALLWYAFSIGTNNHIRTKAQDRPDSWMYLYISLFDQVLAATIFRKLSEHQDGLTGEPRRTPDPIHAADLELIPRNTITRDYAVRIFLNPQARVPGRAKLIISPLTIILSGSALGLLFEILLYSSLIQFFEYDTALLIVLPTSIIVMTFLMIAMVGEWGPFSLSMKLHMNPFLLLVATNTTLYVHSSWLPRTLVSVADASIICREGPFVSELVLQQSSLTPTVVFSYPSYFRQYLEVENGVRGLADEINKLIVLARRAPTLDLDTPRW